MVPGVSPERHLLALAHIAQPILRNYFDATCCVPAALTTVDVLTRWGIRARPLYCQAIAMNKEWERGDRVKPAHSVLVGPIDLDDGIPTFRHPEPDGGGLEGHLVVAGKIGSSKFLLDPAAWQMHRPHHRILIPYGLAITASKPFTGEWAVRGPLPEDGLIMYANHPDTSEPWKKTRHFTFDGDPWYREVHNEVSHALQGAAEMTLAKDPTERRLSVSR